ncbi:YdcH family protein [Aerophototrophica crusticola]|uniref:YdcH family protein n=1 Tax=Aerophototrophica crusticola TaxID=1709002 RepID=A0A858R4H3_9PROT|nr:YdcH family protein [Rhodospirillaceae bacterium B3]
MLFPERLEALRTRHQKLDEAVRLETKRPYPDGSALKQLKLEKLRVKEEMDRLSRH